MHIIKDKTIEPIVNNLIKAGVENAAFAHMEQVGHGNIISMMRKSQKSLIINSLAKVPLILELFKL